MIATYVVDIVIECIVAYTIACTGAIVPTIVAISSVAAITTVSIAPAGPAVATPAIAISAKTIAPA
jgi:hypothetical protein